MNLNYFVRDPGRFLCRKFIKTKCEFIFIVVLYVLCGSTTISTTQTRRQPRSPLIDRQNRGSHNVTHLFGTNHNNISSAACSAADQANNSQCQLTSEQRRTAILDKLLYTLGLDAAPRIPQALQNRSHTAFLEQLPLSFAGESSTDQYHQQHRGFNNGRNHVRYLSDIDRSVGLQEAYDSSGWTRGTSSSSSNRGDDMATTERLVVVAEEDPSHVISNFDTAEIGENGFIYFNISQIRRSSRFTTIAEANLWLYIRQADNVQDPFVNLSVYDVNCSSYQLDHRHTSTAHRHATMSEHFDDDDIVHTSDSGHSSSSFHSFANSSGWMQIDSSRIKTSTRGGQWTKTNITNAFQRWFDEPVTNCGVFAFAPDVMGNDYVVNRPHDEEESLLRPILEIVPGRSTSRRIRRYLGDCTEESPAAHCCRYPLVVDFHEHGWDFIIKPQQYDAYYCKGECGSKFVPEHNHGHMFLQKNPQGSGGPCCTPTEMSSLQIIYIDHLGSIVQSRIPDMIVKKCGCS